MASDVTVIMRTRGADGVTADVKRVGTAADDSANRVAKFGKALSTIGQIAGGITLANAAERGFGKLQDFIGSSIQAASQLEQSVGSVETVFGRASGKMLEFGDKAD